MKIGIGYKDALTFTASLLVSCSAAIAVAAVVSQGTPTTGPGLRSAPEVVRLEPVVVTVSKAMFDSIRTEETIARGSDRTTRG